MKIPKRTTWFLIADSAKARIIESNGPHQGGWRVIEEWADEDARTPSRELERDRPPRGRTIGTGEPFTMEGRSEHDKAGEAFLAARAGDLAEAAKQTRYDQLVIVAPPSALGYLRKKLHPDVTAKVIGVYDKDLTNETERELHAYFVEKLEHW
ncbi:host attachment protein [Hyphococcus luteus]|nr:host attachment protein [Marinicaulis flavus]